MTYLFLILFFLPLSQCTFDDEVYSCSDGKIWQCSVERVDDPPTLNQIPDSTLNPIKSSRRRRPPNIYFSHLNKVSPEDGSFYIAARLKIELQQIVLKNATGMFLQIVPKDPSLKPLYFHAQIKQRRSVLEGFGIDFTFPIENLLEYEQHYTLKFDLLPLNLNISSEKSLFVQGYSLPEMNCNQQIEHDDRRQYVTSRFTSSFRMLTVYPYLSTVNLSFYAAPRPYCLSYEVQLAIGGSYVVETHYIHSSEMQEQPNGTTLIGTVTLTKLMNDYNYTLRLIPYSSTNSCVCLDCSCMLVESQLFTLPKIKSSRKKTKTANSKLSTRPFSSSKQQIRIEIADDPNSNNYMVLLSVFFCILSLTFISASLIIILCRHTNKPSALLLIKSARISQQQKPLLNVKNTQTILLLNAEPTKHVLVETLAKMLEQMNGQICIVSAERAQKEVEKNLHAWCHNAVLKADKIILFHANRAAFLLSNTKPSLANQNAVFDIAFQTLISLIRINDSRFIHVCWNNQRVTMFHNVETIYVLPRDLHFLFNAMNVTSNFEQLQKFQDEYQTAIQPAEETTTQKTTITQPILSTVGQIIAQTEIGCPETENAPYDSGFITISSMGEDFDEHNKDIISVGGSEDSGLIL